MTTNPAAIVCACLSAIACGASGGGSGRIIHSSPGGGVSVLDVAARSAISVSSRGADVDALPDGRFVHAWAESVFDDVKLVISDAAGSTRTTLAVPGQTVAPFATRVNDDGSRIALTYYPRGFAHTLADVDGVVVLDMTGAVVGSVGGVFDAAWLPDGRLVAAGTVEASDGISTPVASGLFLISADLRTATKFGGDLADPMQPAASPDGTRVAFRMNGKLWTIGIDGSGLLQITTGDKEALWPAWSPDGTRIAFGAYGTFETTFYSALACVPAAPAAPIALEDGDASLWPLDDAARASSSLGRVNIHGRVTWQ